MKTLFKSISVMTLILLFIPFFTHAETNNSELCPALRALVANFPSPSAALMSSVDGMCPPVPTVTPSQALACTNARALTVGLHEPMTHAQVKSLQIFLNNNGSVIAQSGDGSYGNETTYFGTKTEIAVQNWQSRNGVVTGGSPETTGYGSVGAQTRAKMVMVACGDTPAVATKPSITTTSLPRGVLGSVYRANIVSVGGIGIRDWEVTSGALPLGVYLNKLAFVQGAPVGEPFPGAQGQPATMGVYGTPTTAGTYTFTVTVYTGTQSASKQFTIVIGTSAVTSTNPALSTNSDGKTICTATGELASTVAGQECTAPVLTLQYYPSTHSLYWGVVRPQTGGTCTASGSWSGAKANTGEYALTSNSGTYSLTCTGAGVKTVVATSKTEEGIVCTTDAKLCPDGSYVSRTGPSCSFAVCPSGEAQSGATSVIDDVTEINPTNVLQPIPGTKRSSDVVVTLKANNSTGPVTVGRGDSLNFTWSSNAPVTNCKRGTNFKNSSAFTQNFGTSGSMPAELARYTYTTSSTQGFDYSISCSYRKEGQSYDTEKGDDLRVNVTPVSTMPASIAPVTY